MRCVLTICSALSVHGEGRRISIPRSLLCICVYLLLALAPPIAFAALPSAAPAKVTTYAQMTANLKAEAVKSPFVHVTSIGKSAGGQRELWLVRLADPSVQIEKTMRLLVLCRQHGDEPASTEAILRLIHGIASGGDPSLRAQLSHMTLYLIPMVNPDGAGAGTRGNGKGADLNRDWGVFKQPETRVVARAVGLIHPALIVDAHNWDGSDEYNADCIEIPGEMESVPGRAAHAMQQRAIRDLAACGYRVHPTAWGSDSDPHLAHRWFTHQQITSLLVETHYGPVTDRADFERREGMYTALIHCLARNYDAPWTRQASQVTQEAALFSPPPRRMADTQKIAAVPRHFPHWLWAFAVYTLTLWGVSQRVFLSEMPLRTGKTPRRSGRYYACYSFSRKRDGTETISRFGHRKAARCPLR